MGRRRNGGSRASARNAIRVTRSRQGGCDEQLYALSLYIYSLQPPLNPNRPTSLSDQGRRIFDRERCPICHAPPLYTNNTIVAARAIGTDATLTTATRRGTGYYKVPSLRGVWYRGPFEHNGSIATLEDWFDRRRLAADYVPTGFKRAGIMRHAVRGHQLGLDLNEAERRALIAFLKTL